MHTLRAPISSAFNPFLQKFYEMIREIIVSKLCTEFSWFFVDRVLLTTLLWRTTFRKRKYLETNLFLKKSAHHHICTNVLKEILFQKNVFLRTCSFFRDYKTTDLGLLFCTKSQFYIFFQVWLFNFSTTLKTCFKNIFRKNCEKLVILLF